MDFKSLPWWGHLLIAVGVALALVWGAHKVAPASLSAKKTRVEDLRSTLEKKQIEIRKGRQATAKLDELERDIAALELKLSDLRQILPTEPEVGDLLRWIKSLADQTNLDLRKFNPGSLVEQELVKEQPIQMDVVGNYHQLGLFYDRVSKHARIINVENVRIQPTNDATVRGATIAASFTAKTFIYREPKPAGGAS